MAQQQECAQCVAVHVVEMPPRAPLCGGRPQPLNGRPTSILIVALDHLADGDADVVIVANSEPMVSAPPCWRGTIANVDYVEGRLVMQIVRIGLNLANMFS